MTYLKDDITIMATILLNLILSSSIGQLIQPSGNGSAELNDIISSFMAKMISIFTIKILSAAVRTSYRMVQRSIARHNQPLLQSTHAIAEDEAIFLLDGLNSLFSIYHTMITLTLLRYSTTQQLAPSLAAFFVAIISTIVNILEIYVQRCVRHGVNHLYKLN